MQKKLSNFLKEKFKKAKIIEEFPFIHGTADLLMKHKKFIYIFELKSNPCQRLIDQILNHKIVADYIFFVACIPKRNKTLENWEKKINDLDLNLIWIENIDNYDFKKINKNNYVKTIIRKKIYGI